MQLARRTRRVALWAALSSIVSVFLSLPKMADADEEPSPVDAPAATPKTSPKKPEDTSTKRASMEIAAYSDSDHVAVFTPSISASIENVTQGASLHASYLVDVVSAASVDIVSTASRRWREIRQAGSLEAEYKPHDFGVSVAGSVSSEPDYLAYGFGAQLVHDFFEKNLTLTGGFGYGHDTAGRGGTPFSVFSHIITRGSFNGGLVAVINRATVGGLTMDIVSESGDQSKPYRYIPMFDAATAAQVPKGASIDYVTSHRLFERPLEQLPLARNRFALTARIAHRLDASTLRAEERVYDDNWGLTASTTDARWVFDLGRRVSFWPHGRAHIQSAASFWQRAYTSGPAPGWDLPEFRTGDRELGPLWTVTGGGGVQLYLGSKAEPRKWAVSLTTDVMYTSFLDDLYLTSRTGWLGAITLEGEL